VLGLGVAAALMVAGVNGGAVAAWIRRSIAAWFGSLQVSARIALS